MRRSRLFVTFAVLLWLAGPAMAYVVFLRDGSKLIAKDKYRVAGAKALITLPNGTETEINLSEIDVARTEGANKENLGTAVVIEDGKSTTTPKPIVAPQRATLSDYIQKGSASLHVPPETHRVPDRSPSGTQLARTAAGFDDLSSLARTPYRDNEVAGEILTFLLANGTEGAQVYAGTNGRRPLLELTTNSEASIFRGILSAANTLIHVREKFGAKVEAIELVLITPQRGRGGQFVLTPEQAADLLARRIDLTAFYVANVQF